MEPFVSSQSLLNIDSWTKLNEKLVAGITTRLDGYSQQPFGSLNLGLHVNDKTSDVIKNRNKVAALIDFPLATWVCAEQVHGNKVHKVTREDRGKGTLEMATAVKGADGLYTNERNILLTACYADCVPLYFFAPNYEMIGVAHAGWRGTVGNIAGKMIDEWLTVEQIPRQDIYACIGPAIGKCCYVVDKHVIDQVNQVLGQDGIGLGVYERYTDGQYKLDLKEVNHVLLKKAGILTKNIEISTYCTSCCTNLLYSHRRDAGKTGRLMSFIGMKD